MAVAGQRPRTNCGVHLDRHRFSDSGLGSRLAAHELSDEGHGSQGMDPKSIWTAQSEWSLFAGEGGTVNGNNTRSLRLHARHLAVQSAPANIDHRHSRSFADQIWTEKVLAQRNVPEPRLTPQVPARFSVFLEWL